MTEDFPISINRLPGGNHSNGEQHFAILISPRSPLSLCFVPQPQRMDLGECPKIHDLALRADYELASKDKDFYYDIEVGESIENKIVELS